MFVPYPLTLADRVMNLPCRLDPEGSAGSEVARAVDDERQKGALAHEDLGLQRTQEMCVLIILFS